MARVLISMPEEFLNMIDTVADDENRSRSELIREALRTYIYKQKVKVLEKCYNKNFNLFEVFSFYISLKKCYLCDIINL